MDTARECGCGCGEAVDPLSRKVYASDACRKRAARRRGPSADASSAPTPPPDASRGAQAAPGGPFDVPADTAGTVPGARAAVETRRAARYRETLEADGAVAARRWIRLVPVGCLRGDHDLKAWTGGAVICADCDGRLEAGAMTWPEADDGGAPSES